MEGHDGGNTQPARDDEEFEQLLAQCIDCAEQKGLQALEALLAAHPQHANALRAHLQLIDDSGMLAAERPQIAPDRTHIGDFRLIRELGRGGMGVVFLAEQESLGREVALKVVRAEFVHQETAVQRFEREARAVAKLAHPNIVEVFTNGQADGVFYIAMQYVPGRGLDELLHDAARVAQPVAVADAIRWIRDVARALASAHAADVIHRDVKPSNIRITPESEAMLLDFGLARDLGVQTMTVAGLFHGSPYYASPEQVDAERGTVGPPSDVYSLGVTLYECVTGATPFAAESTARVFHRVLNEPPQRPRLLNTRIQHDLETVILKAIEKQPGHRYASMTAFADDLDAILDYRPIQAQPPGAVTRTLRWAQRNRAAAGAALAIAIAFLAVPTVLIWRAAADAAADRAAAEVALDAARTKIAEYRGLRERHAPMEKRVRELQFSMGRRVLTDAEYAELDASEAAVVENRDRREELAFGVLREIERAKDLDPDIAGASELRANLYEERWRESLVVQGEWLTPEAAAAAEADERRSRQLVADVSDGQRQVALRASFEVITEPPGAAVYAFRYREDQQLLRHVPVPVAADGSAAPTAVAPGTRALRVIASVEPLHKHDLILAIGGVPVTGHDARAAAERGGVRATVYRAGEQLDVRLPSGLRVRVTAAPLLVSESCRIGTTPIVGGLLHGAAHVLLVRAPGFEDVRVFIGRYGDQNRIRLVPEGRVPPGLVSLNYESPEQPTFLMDREVTSDEYLEFLNDPQTRREIDLAAKPTDGSRSRRLRYPRDGRGPGRQYWPADGEGRFRLPDFVPPDWPVVGISWHDAVAYAKWLTDRMRARGYKLTYRLPSVNEWDRAGLTSTFYVFGNRFRARWICSCFSTGKPGVQPVLRYPIDESPLGLFDMSGSAMEWLDGTFDATVGDKPIAGGSWGHAKPDMFRVNHRMGMRADDVSDTVGFRLLAVLDPN